MLYVIIPEMTFKGHRHCHHTIDRLDLLLVSRCNYVPIFYRFRYITVCCWKIAIFMCSIYIAEVYIGYRQSLLNSRLV